MKSFAYNRLFFRRIAAVCALAALFLPGARAASALPAIYAFNVAAESTINLGTSTSLNWSVGGATKITLTPGIGDVTHLTSVGISPTATTTYTLTASNAAGSVTKTRVITVVAPPTFQSLAAAPPTIVSGAASTLSWSAPGANYYQVTASVGASPGQTSASSVVVHPKATTVYTVTAVNTAGSAAQSITVNVTAAPSKPSIASFAASPSSVPVGGQTTLSWSVSGATSLAIDQGIGPVTGTSVTANPTAKTVYTLTATNGAGSVTQTVTVKIAAATTPPPPPTGPVISSFGATPAFVTPGASSTLAWAVSGAVTLQITSDVGPAPGDVSTLTTVVVTPAANTVYTLTATDANGLKATATTSVSLFNSSTSSIVHPRIWVTPATAAQLNQRAAANDAAWLKLRADCDQYLTMPIAFPDQAPSSGTINGGYEYLDYLLPSEELALGYISTKISDPTRAAKYAAKERQFLLALSDPTHHGDPTVDSGYGIRTYVPALAIGYDWIFETLSDADRAQIYTEINRWVASYDAKGFGREFPQGNYFAGDYCAKALGALATEGENPNGPAMWSDWLNRMHYGMVQPYYSQWLSGGGAPDGWNYGPFETINMLRPIAAVLTAKGLDLIHDPKPFAYPDGHARWMTQFTWPDLTTVGDRGFVYNDSNPTGTDAGWATEFNGLLHLANGDNAGIMQTYAVEQRTLHGLGNVEPWAGFLFYNATAPAADYHTTLSLQTVGDGQVAMRSSWDPTAVWAEFQAGPYTGYSESGEELYDQGSLTIQRGNVQFVVNTWGALMRYTPGTTDGDPAFNFVYPECYGTAADGVEDGRRIFNTYYAVRSGGLYGQSAVGPGDVTPGATLSRFEEGSSYVLMRGEHLEAQYDGGPITGWNRTVAYIRPQLFVVYDRTSVKSASTDNWLAWHVERAPVERTDASPGTHTFDVIDTRAAFGGNLYRGRVTTVLPAGNTVTTVDAGNFGKVYRLEIRPAQPVATETWLTVLDASASAATAASAAPLSAGAGNVLGGAVEGTVIAETTGSNAVVLFGKAATPVVGGITIMVPAADTYALINDLSPSTGYSITATAAGTSLTLQITPGGTFLTTAKGTLSVGISATGAVIQR